MSNQNQIQERIIYLQEQLDSLEHYLPESYEWGTELINVLNPLPYPDAMRTVVFIGDQEIIDLGSRVSTNFRMPSIGSLCFRKIENTVSYSFVFAV